MGGQTGGPTTRQDQKKKGKEREKKMISRARVMGIQIVIVQRQPTTRAPLFVPTIDLSRPALAHDTIKERAASYSVGQSPLCRKRAKKAAVGWMGEGDDEHGKYSGVSPAKGLLLKEEDRPTKRERERGSNVRSIQGILQREREKGKRSRDPS